MPTPRHRKTLVQALLDRLFEERKDGLNALAFPTLFWTDDVRTQLASTSKQDITAANRTSAERSCAFFRSFGLRRIVQASTSPGVQKQIILPAC